MKTLYLYSSDTNRNAAFMKAGVWMLSSVLALLFIPFGLLLAVPLFGIGFWFGGPELGLQSAQRPSFEADENSFTVDQKFSVTERNRLSWDEFLGVELRTVGFGSFLKQRVLVVKTASRGEQKIRQPMMSGTPEEMAQEIKEYAKHAQRKACLVEAMSAIPAQPLVGSVGSPNSRRANPLLMASAGPMLAQTQARETSTVGPVHSFPKFSDRLFGRHKVN